MDLTDIIAIAWRRRLTIAVVAIVAIVVSAGVALTRTKEYESTQTLALFPNVKYQSGQVGANSITTLLPTYATVADSPANKATAASLLGHPLNATVSSATTAGTGILKISATSADPQAAASAAGAVSQAFDQTLGTKAVLVAQTVGQATVPTAPVSPNKTLIIGAGVILGLALGLALALVLDRWFDKVSSPEEVTAATGLACLGMIPLNRALRAGGASSLVWGDDPDLFRLQEAMRSLRTTMQLSMDVEDQVLQVTSPSPGDGKSTVSANLAVAIASVGIPTTIIDADFWAPRQHLIFGISNARGLSGAIAADSADAPLPLQRTAFRNLAVLPSGPLPNNPTELIAAGMESVLDRLRKLGRVIVIDSPPALSVSDARLIAAQADSVVIVASAGQTKASILRLAVEQLQLAQSNVAGIVLNGVRKTPAERVATGSYYMRPGQSVEVAGHGASSSDA